MFFTITKKPTHHLKNKTVKGEWTIMTDDGWQTYRDRSTLVIEKGLGTVDCRIECDGRGWEIKTKGLRRFPLWKSGDSVSNIHVSAEKIHNPHSVGYRNGKIIVTHKQRPVRLLPSIDRILPRHEVEEQLITNLLNQATELLKYDLPIVAPISQGVDCALVRAVLDYTGIQYSSIGISDNKIDKSHLKHQSFWGYGQMLDEGLPHIQATGYNGDAYMSRDPIYVSLYLRKWGIDLVREFDKAGATYMRNTFDRYYRKKLVTYQFPEDPDSQLVDMLINDFQVWHIDECLTWTPFADPEIMRLGISIDPDTALDQVLHAGLSRSLIKRLSPSRLEEIQKNHNGTLPV